MGHTNQIVDQYFTDYFRISESYNFNKVHNIIKSHTEDVTDDEAESDHGWNCTEDEGHFSSADEFDSDDSMPELETAFQ